MQMKRILYIACAIATMFGLFRDAPATNATTSPGKNGKIAYTQTIDGTSSIWTMNPNGTNQRMLVSGGVDTPVWSPNGHAMAFTARGQLRIMSVDGSWQKRLTMGIGFSDSSPVWSVDGSQIAFVRTTHVSGRSAVFIMRPNGTYQTNISGWHDTLSYRAPSWSPEADKLVYEQYGGETESRLLIKNLQNGQVTELTTLSGLDLSDVAWSPNGKKLLYNDSYGQVYTIWPDGTRKAFIEDFDGECISLSEQDGTVAWIPINKSGYQTVGFPTWSPDGTKLIFAMGNASTSDVFMLDLGSEKTTLIARGQQVGDLQWQAK